MRNKTETKNLLNDHLALSCAIHDLAISEVRKLSSEVTSIQKISRIYGPANVTTVPHYDFVTPPLRMTMNN